MKRNLIFSKNEKYLNLKQPTLFIGNWCLEGVSKEKLSELDYQTCDSFSFKKEERIKNYTYCETIFLSIINDLKDNLNQLHNVNFSTRSWEIIIGVWLRKFIYIVFNRLEHLKNALNNHQIDKIYLLETTDYKLFTKDTAGFESASIDEEWNHVLYSEIFKFIKTDQTIIYDKTQNKFIKSQETFTELNKKSLKMKFAHSIIKIFKAFKRNKDALIYESGLRFFQEKKLEILLSQIPQVWYPPPIGFKSFDPSMRAKIDLKYNNYKDFEKIVRYLIPNSMPVSALESFEDINSLQKKMGFPKKPKLMFTSNAFNHDEIFKLYAANKVDEGTPYIIGQHGSSYFTLIDNDYVTENNTCSKFISWGSLSKSKTKSAFNFKALDRKKLFDKDGFLTIVCRSLGWRAHPYDRHKEKILGIKSTVNLLEKLPPQIRKKTILRLHSSYLDRGKHLINNHFKNFDVNLDYGKSNIKKIFKKTKVTFFNYDGTGILENLALDMPTICYWDNTFNHLTEEAVQFYQYLVDAKILFLDLDESIRHLNKYWNNIDEWWLDKNTQEKIKLFNEQLNIVPNKNPLKSLSEILKNNIINN